MLLLKQNKMCEKRGADMLNHSDVLNKKKYKKSPEVRELVIQKTNPLRVLSETDMTLSEFKILDVYLGRIDSRNPDSREVVFTKGELERLLEVTQIEKGELKKRVNNLGRMVEISDPNDPNKLKMVSLFERANAWKYEDGFWKIILKCTPSAMKYIFNIENIGYIRYRLHNILHLTSRYSYFLFLYLEHNRFRKAWKVSVDTLKQTIGCSEKTYEKYYRFNQLVLTSAQKELHSKTNIRFEYKGIKIGRSTKIIEFKITKLPKELEELKREEKIQNNSIILENNNYTQSNIDGFSAAAEEETLIEIEPVQKKRKSLIELERKYEEVMQEDSFLAEIKEQFKYNVLIQQNSKYTNILDFTFQVLCDMLGTDADTIKIRGEEKSVDIVIPRLLKLKPEEILYVAKKYSELEDVKNPKAFISTMLFGVVGTPVPKIKKKPRTSYDLDELIARNSIFPVVS